MNILQINKFYYRKGGITRYFFELNKLLDSKGHKLIPFSMQDNRNMKNIYSRYFVNNLDYSKKSLLYQFKKSYKIISKTIYSFESKKKIERLIKDTKPDIVHIHSIYHHISPSILHSLKKFNIPIVYTLHDYKLICPNYRLFIQHKKKICEKCKKYKYYNVFLNKCVKNSFLKSFLIMIEMYFHKLIKIYNNIDLFIAPSKFIKNKFIEFGFDENKIIYIPHFIDHKQYNPSYKNKNYILYFGRLVKEKGIYTLLKAMKNIKNTELYIVGTGEEETNLKRFAIKNKLNVKFLGFKKGKKLKNIIKNSKFVIVPSEWYEVFGLVVLESFASGKPVIGSRIGGITELIDENKTGLLFKPGNYKELNQKINYLLNNRKKIIEMGKNVRKLIEKEYNPGLHYKKIMNIYNKLINERNSNRNNI